eukprot:CAMPEP_0204904680 /NCGR_PEP_ID=MMETSP1397-20131031/4993_1 /ASSEMBLY_ACC=CAM_ASM_000891 /TAXON_ID=49980 /ORGANISM="Climacostomum Climacostomum virens, Strain Stock W-24" /LENGTH=495 /DNA_ID=CAMNT_0052073491 /DNA_START=1031 /DNA_END=2518 /DNA_ORIENTATION=+
MTGYGRHVLAAPATSWSVPVFNPNYYTQQRVKTFNTDWRDELEGVREALYEQKKLRRDKQLLGQLHSLVDTIQARNKPPPPPPPPDRFAEILGYLAKQQETLTELVKGVVEDRKEHREYMQGQFMANREYQRPVNPIEEQYRRVQQNPNEFKQMLAELDFNDDEAEEYIDADKKFRFDPNLTPEQKAAIMQQVRANRDAQRQKEIRRQIRGKRRFRVIGWVVAFPRFLQNSILYRRTVMRESNIKQMEDSIKVYAEVAHSWIMKAVRMPLVSVLNDPNLDLNILGTKPEYGNSKFMKLQVRIKGIIQGLSEHTSNTEMPTPLRMFIDRYTSNGAYIPQKSVTSYERSRMEWDQFGAICNQTREKQHMLACVFIVTRHLVDILMRPKENSLSVRTAKTAQNMRIIASIMQLLVLTLFARTGRSSQEAVVDETDIMERRKGQNLGLRNDDGVSGELYCLSEFEGMAHLLKPFLEEMREELRLWCEDLLRLCSKARLG